MDTKSAFWFLSLLLGCRAQEKSYTGYEVIETEKVSKDTLKVLYLHTGQWDFLKGPILGQPAQILVPPQECPQVKKALNSEHISFQVVEENVQRLLDESKVELPYLPEGSITYQKYMNLSEIYAYLDHLENRYPKLASVRNIGNSSEGRPIKAVKISSGGENKPVIFVDATIHAREWIAPCAAVYLIDQLAGNYTTNRGLVDKFDWHVVPVLNVDGFEYSHTKDRMWRKTRSDTGNPECKGVDANRNFPFHWDESFDRKPCLLTYPGKSPMSEPEIRALVDAATSIKDRIKLYIGIHTYGPDLLYPWGYTETPVEDEDDLKSLGDKVVAAVKLASGTNFSCGSITQLLYKAPGNSADWAKGSLGVKYSYIIELNSGGFYAFDPPPAVILPTVTETFEMFKAFVKYYDPEGSSHTVNRKT